MDVKPTVVIADGKIIEAELKRARMNIPLLMSELRNRGYQDLYDIRYAIIEPNGKLSVIADSQASPLTPKEMGIPTAPVNLSIPLIINGIIDDQNLKFLQRDRSWLREQLQPFEVGKVEDVLLAQYDSSGQLFVNIKNKEPRLPNIF